MVAIIILLCIILIFIVYLMVKFQTLGKTPSITADLERLERMSREDAMHLRQELGQSLIGFNDSIRKTVEERFEKLQADNAQKLEMMRATVDEKLHSTLEKRLGESFSMVSERLEKVHQGLGEMQNLAADVGGLKRVLSNVKTRGTWGEVQLGSLLEQMLAPEQYLKNVKIKENTTEVVEYAVCLPDNVMIPIDSKFPVESFERLMDASEKADVAGMESAGAELEKSIKLQAKIISEKYILPPKTTNFAIMFLPTEGLYAEVMKRIGLANDIQNKYRISITGPSTLGAFLNSLQMGFRTLAIQKRSGEVWQVLSEAKVEFARYAAWVDDVKKKLEAASRVVDDAGKRTRGIDRRLRSVESNMAASQADTNTVQKLTMPLLDSEE